jgi:hypothetical protein
VRRALAGKLGVEYQDAAETTVSAAAEPGFEDKPDRVAEATQASRRSLRDES